MSSTRWPLSADDAGIVRGLDTQRIDEALGEIVRHIDLVGIHAVAIGADQLDIADRHHPARLLVVFDTLGHHLVAGVIDLHASDGRNDLLVPVVDQLIGRKHHFRFGIDLRLQPLRRRILLREGGRNASGIANAKSSRRAGQPTVY